MEGARADVPPGLLAVVLGRCDKSDPAAGERIAVTSVIEHEGYGPDRNVIDLALLQLERPAAAPSVRIAGPGEEALWADGTAATALGYGFEYFEQPLPPDGLNEGTLCDREGAACLREGFEPATDLCAHGAEAAPRSASATPTGRCWCRAPREWGWRTCCRGGLRRGPVRARQLGLLHARRGRAAAGMDRRAGSAGDRPPAPAPPAPAPASAGATTAPAAARKRASSRRSRAAACRRKARRLKGAKRKRALRRCARRR